MALENLVAVAVGGVIGFMSAFGLETLKRHWKAKDDRQRVNRLLEILYEEVEQLGELIDVDLGLVESSELDFVLGYGKDLEGNDGKLRATIARLQENRTIFDSQAGRLLELPDYLPNALVRFYSRLQVNCGKMLAAIHEHNLERLREIRKLSLNEVEVLKEALREARNAR